MSRPTRAAALTATALVLSGLSTIPLAASATADPDPVAAYQAHAGVPLTVHRDDRGHVDFVGSRTHGAQPLGHDADPAKAARTQLGRLGTVLGTDARDLHAGKTIASVDGGTVTRFSQYVSGIPVLGGEVVVGLDENRGVSSAATSLSTASTVTSTRVDHTKAADAAKAVVAREHPAASLTVTDQGTWLYDDQVLDGPTIGQAPVYRFDVSDGAGVRENVLVLAATGSILMHVNEIEGVDRRVCDAANVADTVDLDEDPTGAYEPAPCTSTTAVRNEGDPASGLAQVDSIYDAIGATSDLYASLGVDLTDLIGEGTDQKTLAGTARYCDPNYLYQGVVFPSECPMANAFWNGQEFYAGDGMAVDDVIGHELTHGVIEHNSDLFYFGQTGAINESLADTMGEIVDHREGTDDDSAWRLGEDVHVSSPDGNTDGPLRSMSSPTTYGQPDKMTSGNWDADVDFMDNGGVHTNSGVGNKTAYLISHGGTFNSVAVGTGIDAGDPTLAKTATLYLYVIEHLVSGAEYANLSSVLTTGCDALAQAGTAGFTTADCTTVRNAVKATELTKAPTVANTSRPAQVAATCPTGGTNQTALTLTTSEQANNTDLWFSSPDAAHGIPSNAKDSDGSVFGLDPDPETYGDPYSSGLTSNSFTVPSGSKRTYLRFSHWYLFDWLPAADTDDGKTHYYDGGEVRVLVNGTATTIPTTSWTNGPKQKLDLTNPSKPLTGFGGDSHGWVSSRVDLTPFAGKTIQLQWVVRGDDMISYVGWFIDQASLYSCTANALPNTAKPTISGTRQVGKTLTASKGTWSPAATSWKYQWLRSGAAISGATKQTYALTSTDRGKAISVKVTATSTAWPGGTSGSATSAQTGAIAYGVLTTVKPRISGTQKVGHRLTALRGEWTPAGVSYSYRWYRNGKAISGATGKTYLLKSADRGKRLTLHVTGRKSGYTTKTVYSAKTATIK